MLNNLQGTAWCFYINYECFKNASEKKKNFNSTVFYRRAPCYVNFRLRLFLPSSTKDSWFRRTRIIAIYSSWIKEFSTSFIHLYFVDKQETKCFGFVGNAHISDFCFSPPAAVVCDRWHKDHRKREAAALSKRSTEFSLCCSYRDAQSCTSTGCVMLQQLWKVLQSMGHFPTARKTVV